MAFALSTHAACPNGNYAVKGWNPGVPTSGKESYTGTVAIKTVGGGGTYDAATKMLNIVYGDKTGKLGTEILTKQ